MGLPEGAGIGRGQQLFFGAESAQESGQTGIQIFQLRSSRPAIQIVMSQDTKKDDGCRPVRVAGRQVRFRIKGQAILPIDPDGPGGWIVYNAFQMQTGV